MSVVETGCKTAIRLGRKGKSLQFAGVFSNNNQPISLCVDHFRLREDITLRNIVDYRVIVAGLIVSPDLAALRDGQSQIMIEIRGDKVGSIVNGQVGSLVDSVINRRINSQPVTFL